MHVHRISVCMIVSAIERMYIMTDRSLCDISHKMMNWNVYSEAHLFIVRGFFRSSQFLHTKWTWDCATICMNNLCSLNIVLTMKISLECLHASRGWQEMMCHNQCTFSMIWWWWKRINKLLESREESPIISCVVYERKLNANGLVDGR